MEFVLVETHKSVGFQVLDQASKFQEFCLPDLVPEVYVLIDEFLRPEHWLVR